MITVMTDLIGAHLRHMRAAGFSDRAIEDRRKVLRRMDTDLPLSLEQATVEELTDWLANPNWAVKTRATYHGHVVGFFKWACDARNPLLDYDPSVTLARPRPPQGVPHPVTDAELRRALDHAGDPWIVYIRCAAWAGMRAGEIATIRREAFAPDVIRILGKGGKTRIVPNRPEIWDVVQALPPGRIARMIRDGRPPTPGYMSSRFTERMDTIGLPDVTLHRFRHWYGTMLLRPQKLGGAGADLRTVQELMGHASPATTAVYTLITDEQRRIAVAALPALAPAPC